MTVYVVLPDIGKIFDLFDYALLEMEKPQKLYRVPESALVKAELEYKRTIFL